MEMPIQQKSDVISCIGEVLLDSTRPMKERFRALFTLRNIGGELSVRCIEKCFSDSSALLKHECAYCLGQMLDPSAIPKLQSILQDVTEEPIVRHEAGEALAAIGLHNLMSLLEKYSKDTIVEVAETCQLGVDRLKWLQASGDEELSVNPYNSTDPAPPLGKCDSVHHLKSILLNESLPLFQRYRAMFSLRNQGSAESALALAEGFKCTSALFRHEIAFVLGQMQNSVCEDQLTSVLSDLKENEMVRHECAEALGAIATPSAMETLKLFLNDSKQVVRESCEVALDMCEYENSKEFQYANTLVKVH